jgi:hypothetical protein
MMNSPTQPPRFQYDERLILTIIDRIPADVRGHYPQHIFEPQRIEIARELVLKEYYKLFPMLEAANFEQVSTSILYWLHGSGYELSPVADFWNYIDGTMLTLKLKDVVPQITSANISWRMETLDPHQLQLGTPVGNLAEHGQPPYNYEFINQRILQNAQQMVINRRISDEKSSDTVVPRDHYPILVKRDPDGTLTLLDGNRRTLRALLYGRQTIDAWVGTVQRTPALQDHWVNTGFLRRLLSEYAETPNDEVKASIQSQLRIILNSSSIARFNFQTRCVPHYPFASELVPQ